MSMFECEKCGGGSVLETTTLGEGPRAHLCGKCANAWDEMILAHPSWKVVDEVAVTRQHLNCQAQAGHDVPREAVADCYYARRRAYAEVRKVAIAWLAEKPADAPDAGDG